MGPPGARLGSIPALDLDNAPRASICQETRGRGRGGAAKAGPGRPARTTDPRPPGYAVAVTAIWASFQPIVAAIAGLVATAETIEDEWTYIHDLETVWGARLRAGLDARSGEAPPGFGAAIEGLIAEVARITDPHRAIDWLSTLPQVVLVALGEDAWGDSRTRRRTPGRWCMRGSRLMPWWRTRQTSSPGRRRRNGSSRGPS